MARKKVGKGNYYIVWLTKGKHEPRKTPFMSLQKAEEMMVKFGEGYAMKVMKINPIAFQRDIEIRTNDRWNIIKKINRRDYLRGEEASLLKRLEAVRNELKEIENTVLSR